MRHEYLFYMFLRICQGKMWKRDYSGFSKNLIYCSFYRAIYLFFYESFWEKCKYRSATRTAEIPENPLETPVFRSQFFATLCTVAFALRIEDAPVTRPLIESE